MLKTPSVDIASIQPGARLTWNHVPGGGGYAYVWPVHVTVVAIGKKRVCVEAPLTDGSTKLVWVTPEALRPRATLFD
jgi:hypothetical protein